MIYKKVQQLFGKLEPREGIDASPTPADALEAANITYGHDVSFQPRAVATASHDSRHETPGVAIDTLAFELECRGSGEVVNPLIGQTPSRPPRVGRCLQACSYRETHASIVYLKNTGITVGVRAGTKLFGKNSGAMAMLIDKNLSGESFLLVKKLNDLTFSANEPVIATDPITGVQIATTTLTAGQPVSVVEASWGYAYEPVTNVIQTITLDNADPGTGEQFNMQYPTGSRTDWNRGEKRHGDFLELLVRGLTRPIRKGTKVEGEISGATAIADSNYQNQLMQVSATPVAIDAGTYIIDQNTGARGVSVFYVPAGSFLILIRRETLTNFEKTAPVAAEYPLGTPVAGWTPNPTVTGDYQDQPGQSQPIFSSYTGTFRGNERLKFTGEPETLQMNLSVAVAVAAVNANSPFLSSSGAIGVILEKAKIGSTKLYYTLTSGTLSPGNTLTFAGTGGSAATATLGSLDVFRPEILSVPQELVLAAGLTASCGSFETVTGSISGAVAYVEVAYQVGETRLIVLRTSAADFVVNDVLTFSSSLATPTVLRMQLRTHAYPSAEYVLRGRTSDACVSVKVPRSAGYRVFSRSDISFHGIPTNVQPLGTDQAILYYEPTGAKQLVPGEILEEMATGIAVKRVAPATAQLIIRVQAAVAAATAGQVITGANGATMTLTEDVAIGHTILRGTKLNATAFVNNSALSKTGPVTVATTVTSGTVTSSQAAAVYGTAQGASMSFKSPTGKKLEGMVGSRGTGSVAGKAGEAINWKFDFQGRFAHNSDAGDFPDPDYGDTPQPKRFENIDVGTAAPCSGFSLDLDNSITRRPDGSQPDGLLSMIVSGRVPKLGLTVEATAVAVKDWLSQMRTGVSNEPRNAFSIANRSAVGNSFVAFVPNTQLKSVPNDEAEGVYVHNLGFDIKQDSTSGDDSVLFLFY